MQNKFIINACVNGMAAAKKDNPHLPVSAKEITRDVVICVSARSPHTISETRQCLGL